jgi:pimeloyl-ACP methyl ester carboxylesterase
LIALPSLRVVDVQAADGRRLDGLLGCPPGAVVASVVVLHGKGGNCMSGPSRVLLEGLSDAFRVLSLNMRCHDLAYTRQDLPGVDFHAGDPSLPDGGAWEDLAAGPLDVAAGVGFLRDAGPEPVFVAGHSSGGFHAAQYAASDGALAGRVLLSPLLSNRRPLAHWFPSAEQEASALRTAQLMVDQGKGDLLLPLDAWYYAISARSLLERAAEPPGTWLDAVNRSTVPTLMLWGGAESRAGEWAETFERIEAPDRRPVILPGAEHNYIGHEEALVAAVGEFMREHA